MPYDLKFLEEAARLEKSGDWLRYLAYCRDWINIENENYLAWQGMGDALSNLNRADEAIEAYKQGLKFAPREPLNIVGEIYSAAPLWYRLGNELTALGRHDDAIAALENASKLDNKSIEIWNNLGIAYLNGKKAKKAFEAFKIAYALDQNNIQILKNIGSFYIRAQNRDGIEFVYKKLLNLNLQAAKEFKQTVDKWS